MFSFDGPLNAGADNARALENVRAIVAWKRSDGELMHNSTGARAIRSVGIIGAGTMGAEIAAAHIKHNVPVVVFDNNADALATIGNRTAAELNKAASEACGQAEYGQAFVEQASRLLENNCRRDACTTITNGVNCFEATSNNPPIKGNNLTTGTLAEVAKCDLIIESILEKLSAKQELFGRLREMIPPNAVVVSNTSTIPIGSMADSLRTPEKFCGLHFFHPVRERPLVEIIRGAKTGNDTVASLVAHAKVIDKLPIVVADGPGFLVNRLLLPYLIEALELLMEGASIEMIEDAAVEFGMAKGPFRLMDEIGLDTTLHAGWSMSAAFPERIPMSPILVALIKAGRLGQKSGAGFFSYKDPASVATHSITDPAITKIVARWTKTAGYHSAEDIVLRLILPMILEATRILEEGEVHDPRDIDLGAIFGLGFPTGRGGLLWWADVVGPARLVEMLGPFDAIGPRLKPTRLLLEMTEHRSRFY